jgi:PKD repeat protein
MVTFNALPTTPPGLWTANFQVTNNIIGYALSSQGTGHYVGRGILGTGTNWNVLPCVATVLYGTQTISNATSFEDDGATPSGISCQIINGAAHSSSLAPLTDTSDVGNLLNQYMLVNYGPNALQIQNIPAGTYNVALYGIDGTFGDRGTTFVVHGSNGDQTAATTNSIPTSPLNQGVNFAVVTNVHVAAGTLNVDVNPTTPVPAHNPNTEADFNGFQLQLVSYDAPVAAFSGTPTSGAAPLTVTFINSSTGSITNSVWKFGDGNSVTNSSTAGVSHLYANPGTYTVTLVVTGPGGTSSATNTSYITVNAGVITPISITRGSMHINASGAATFAFTNAPNMSFSVRATNNLNAPVATWPVIGTPVESPAGTYNFTDPNKATNATLFYIISQP